MEPLKPSTASVASDKPLVPSVLGTFAMTAAVVFSLSLLVWQTNKMFCEEVVCRPGRHYLLEPVLNGGPAAWLIAGLVVGAVAALVNLAYRWWRKAR